jgi:RND family efflux transporter MFP subunit
MRRRHLLPVLAILPILPVAAEEGEDAIRGPTRPMRMAALGPPVDGVVREVAVVEGQAVRAGEVLVRLVDDVQAARVGLARVAAEADGELRQAQAQHAEALAVLARTQQAAARGAATEWELRQARSRVDVTKAAADGAEERRQAERQRLELEIATQQQLAIRAPFDGIVTRLETVPGATLLRTDRPVTVADLRTLEAVLYVPAALWRRLRLGEGYRLLLSEPVGGTVPARLRHLDPVMDVASGRFRAVFVISNPEGSVPAGLEATLDAESIPP